MPLIDMKKIILNTILILVLVLVSYQGLAYRPTAEQILAKTATLNRHLDSLQISLHTKVFYDYSDDLYLEIPEQIFATTHAFRTDRQYPDGVDTIIGNGRENYTVRSIMGNDDDRTIEIVLPLLLVHNSIGTLLDNLNYLGVDTNVVTFDRVDTTVAVVIGSKTDTIPGSQLWIEKKRGLLLRFVGVGTHGGTRHIYRTEYMDYTRIEKRFWIPATIEYYRDDVLEAVSSMDEITVNKKIPSHIFSMDPIPDSYAPLTNFLNVKE
jgi:outer membrane lipoprotein-sorting protein